jgi:hypothetical protein
MATPQPAPFPGRAARQEVPSMGTILSVLVLIADIWAVLNIAQSRETTGTKALWIVLVILLPVLGLIIWYFAGPKSASG